MIINKLSNNITPCQKLRTLNWKFWFRHIVLQASDIINKGRIETSVENVNVHKQWEYLILGTIASQKRTKWMKSRNIRSVIVSTVLRRSYVATYIVGISSAEAIKVIAITTHDLHDTTPPCLTFLLEGRTVGN